MSFHKSLRGLPGHRVIVLRPLPGGLVGVGQVCHRSVGLPQSLDHLKESDLIFSLNTVWAAFPFTL